MTKKEIDKKFKFAFIDSYIAERTAMSISGVSDIISVVGSFLVDDGKRYQIYFEKHPLIDINPVWGKVSYSVYISEPASRYKRLIGYTNYKVTRGNGQEIVRHRV